jgi:hypothetical protein
LKIHANVANLISSLKEYKSRMESYVLNTKEIAAFFHFPKNPKTETSLLTVKSRKLALPVGVPSFDYSLDIHNEVIAKNYPQDTNIL